MSVYIYRALRVFIQAHNIEAIDRHLSKLTVDGLSQEELLTYIHVLKPISSKLMNYTSFVDCTYQLFKSRGWEQTT